MYSCRHGYLHRRPGAIGFGMDPSVRPGTKSENHSRLAVLAETERADRNKADAIRIRYEDWATSPERVAEQLSDFVGLDFRSAAPEVTAHLQKHKTSTDLAASVGRWRRERLPEAATDEMPSLLRPFLLDYGYETSLDHLPECEFLPDPSWSHSLLRSIGNRGTADEPANSNGYR